MSKKRGRNAARSGIRGESIMHGAIIPYMNVVRYKDYNGERPMAVMQHPSEHPFHRDKPRAGMNDFMIFGRQETVFVQVKNQNTSGTADEKISFAFDIAKRTIPATPYDIFLFVMLGDWFTSPVSGPTRVTFARDLAAEMELNCKAQGKKLRALVTVGAQELAMTLKELHTEGAL